jgi:hypothetical protein
MEDIREEIEQTGRNDEPNGRCKVEETEGEKVEETMYEDSGNDVEHSGSRLKKGRVLHYPLEMLTDFKADLHDSKLSGSQEFATSSGQGLTPEPRQPRARIIKDRNVSTTAKTSMSFDFQCRYVESILSPQTTSGTSSSQHLWLYCRHEEQWDRLYTEKCIKWDMFPWPVLKQPMTVDEITTDCVTEYLHSLYQIQQNAQSAFDSMEEYVKDQINRWDYNRMDAKVFSRVDAEHQKKAEESVIRVGSLLRAILRSVQVSG